MIIINHDHIQVEVKKIHVKPPAVKLTTIKVKEIINLKGNDHCVPAEIHELVFMRASDIDTYLKFLTKAKEMLEDVTIAEDIGIALRIK